MQPQSSLASALVRRLPLAALVAAPLFIASAAHAQRPAPSRAAAAAHIDSVARAAVESGRVAGLAIVAVHAGDTVVARGWGRADLENDVPMTADHVFELASITKEFTAAATLRLVASGRVELDAPAARYLPALPERWRAVTVRQLLSHTSGIPDHTEQMGARPGIGRLDVPPESLLAMVQAVPEYFAPGAFMRYSNTGYAILGMLIERVTGQPYGQWVRDSVLRPAGLVRTEYCDHRRVVPRRARGYRMGPNGFEIPEFLSYSRPYSAGSFCGTAGDLARWNVALHGGRVLPAAQYAEMVRPTTIAGGARTRYGLGIVIDRIDGRRSFHHGGDIGGFTTWTAWLPDDSLNVTVLINTQGPVRPDVVGGTVATAILGAVPEAKPRFAGSLAALAGRYGGDVVFTVVAAPDGGQTLAISRGPLPTRTLRYVGDFTFTDGRARYRFDTPTGSSGSPAVWADLGVSYVRWDREG